MPHVCPWWLTCTFDNTLRRWLHDPQRILGPFVQPGMRVADLGCGMGHFTLGLARLVGEQGRVLAVDLQPRQLRKTGQRLARAGLLPRVELVQAQPTRLGLSGQLDFVLAFWMLHEVPDPQAFLQEVHAHLRPAGRMLVAEPRAHVNAQAFQRSRALFEQLGGMLQEVDPPIRLSRAVLLQWPAAPARAGGG
jgi:ubiquinone/menaquinone biosynthesis C-methylase UbiE